MEYAYGRELFERICNAGRFSEAEARYFFQQLICGVDYCHSLKICHKDLKLENTLLDGSPAPLLKICDFGYSKSSLLHSRPKPKVGTPAYIAPEVLSRREYDGKHADVWSCGVTLYVMLVGGYPQMILFQGEIVEEMFFIWWKTFRAVSMLPHLAYMFDYSLTRL